MINKSELEKLDAGEQSLYMWQFGFVGEFEKSLWQTISSADENNLTLLGRGWLLHVCAFIKVHGWWDGILTKVGRP